MDFNEINPYIRRIALFKEKRPWKLGLRKCNYEHRIAYITEGCMKIKINEKENITCHRGTVIYWLPGTWYSIYDIDTEGFGLYAIYFDYTYSRSDMILPWSPPTEEDYDPLYLDKNISIDDQPELNNNFYIGKCNEMEPLFNNIHREYSFRKIGCEKHISAQLQIILIEAIRHLKINAGKHNNIRTADKIISFIHDNITESLNYVTLAESLHYNPNYINHVIKQATGLSLHQYLTAARIDKAVEMIESSDKSITDIALALGFCNSSHLASVFKQLKGFLPSDLRSNTHILKI